MNKPESPKTVQTPTPAVTPAIPGNPRADAMNPNNPASKAAQDNRSRQLNPQDPTSQKSRGSK